MTNSDQTLRDLILQLVPDDGKSIGNKALRDQIAKAAPFEIADTDYFRVREGLIAEGLLIAGRGRGGSVMQTPPKPNDETIPEADPTDPENAMILEMQENPTPGQPKSRQSKKASAAPNARKDDPKQVISYRFSERRKNNPPVGMVDTTSDGVEETVSWSYDPHIDPALNFDTARAGIEDIIDDALASGDSEVMLQALEQLKRMQTPYLNWTGKAERTSFEVDTVSLHVHERIDPATILAAIQKRIKNRQGKKTAGFQMELFSAAFENLPLREAIDFYKHDRDWANRLIAGDSLLVMNSLLQKESMAGKVQMIYIDPPYGIKYKSNFQPFTNKRNISSSDKPEDLTAEPEQIRAFRDTWELGIHSYLTYLRDRLLLARELLTESGSIFVQINAENQHLVVNILSEVFGSENFVANIIFRKKSIPLGARFVETMHDHLLLFAKDKRQMKYRHLYEENDVSSISSHGPYAVYPDNSFEKIETNDFKSKHHPPGTKYCRLFTLIAPSYSKESDFEYEFEGKKYAPPSGGCWVVSKEKLDILRIVNRLQFEGNSLSYRLFFEDFPYKKITALWNTVGTSYQKVYAVQTAPPIVQRCLLMTTDPGDLVLDPTCGSGTTAFVAEKWGRRWITCDTSRVAITLAKQRLITASYDYYDLKYSDEGLKGGFIYKTVPHVTLKAIANNPEIDEICGRMHPTIEKALADLNAALKGHRLTFEIKDGGRKDEILDFTKEVALLEEEVPFDLPENWPEAAQKPFDSFHADRQAMQKKIDAAIAAHAEPEILYDQPQVSKTKLRISGPFTVEAVPFATVLALDEAQRSATADAAIARSGETSRQAQWRDELLKTGIRGKGGQKLDLADLEPIPELKYIHAVGTLAESGDRVAVSFGPEFAALEQRQVEIALREAGGLFPLPKMLVFCAFTFDPEAAKDIDALKGITAIKVQMNTDLLTEDLKKARASNESFWLMGQPDVEIHKTKDGLYQVEVHGFDYFDTKTGELQSGGKNKIALWALDTDYDDRSLYPKQIFFPMAGATDGWNKLKKDIKAELDEGLLSQYHGTISIPFEAGENRRIGVKIVDDRGIESLKIMDLD